MKFITPSWPVPSFVKAYTTSKLSWGSRFAHHDINKGNINFAIPGYKEESAHLRTLLNLPDEPIWITQTHSNLVIPAEPANREQNADASYTGTLNRVCAILTADCLPVLLCNRQGTKVAAIHAGWRGLANQILRNAISAMDEPPKDILAWLGPAISQQKFEVGSDVYESFIRSFPQSKLAFKPHQESAGKWFADLYLLAKMQLVEHGVQQIYGGGFCTYLQENLFFSYRRDQGKTGRMATLIWIDKN